MTPEQLIKKIETTVAALDASTAQDITASTDCRDYARGLKMGAFMGTLRLSHMGFDLIEEYSRFEAWRDNLLALPKTRAAYAAKHLRAVANLPAERAA